MQKEILHVVNETVRTNVLLEANIAEGKRLRVINAATAAFMNGLEQDYTESNLTSIIMYVLEFEGLSHTVSDLISSSLVPKIIHALPDEIIH